MASKFLQPSIVLGALVAATSCFPPDDGRNPPLDRIYFPVGIAVNPDNNRFYVANSDFDLQFNAGSLQVYNLRKIREDFLPRYCTQQADCESGTCDLGTATRAATHWCVKDLKKPCGALGEKTDSDRLLAPGRCGALDPKSIKVTSVEIGAFVTDVLYRTRPGTEEKDGIGRLFLPVRGDATLHWADVGGKAGDIDCGQRPGHVCDDNHRRGENAPAENTRDTTLPAEPFAVAADDTGKVIVTTHQSDGSVALFVNTWGKDGGPRLQHVLGGLPTGVIGISFVPPPEIVDLSNSRDDLEDIVYEPGFLAIYRDSPQVTLLRYFDEAHSTPPRPFLAVANVAPITALAQGYNSRGVVVDSDKRKRCEVGCHDVACETACADVAACQSRCGATAGADGGADAGDCTAQCENVAGCEARCVDAQCTTECAGIPLDVYISNRTPAALLLGDTQPDQSPAATTDVLNIYGTVSLLFGPSRVVLGDVIDRDGTLARRVFIVCFDSRMIFVYDPKLHRIETEIHTGRGPHAFAVAADENEGGGFAIGLIGHFTDSYLGVVDLDQRHVDNYGQIVLTIGEPTPPRASK